MTIAENIQLVRAQIAASCARVGRDPSEVVLIAVSKTHPFMSVLEAVHAGMQHFGENRVEEAIVKIPEVEGVDAHALTWHMIGHIQSRKAKDLLPLFQVVHSVDTLKLADKLSRLAVEQNQSLSIFLEINVSGEATKAGFEAFRWQTDAAIRAALMDSIKTIASLPGLYLRGFMTMAPIVETPEQTRPVFASLAQLQRTAQTELGVELPDLSMGMTDDYPVAIEEGATLVRVGRAIFGERTR
jgi:pyridoxal phosphate enzyme (YggS family)